MYMDNSDRTEDLKFLGIRLAGSDIPTQNKFLIIYYSERLPQYPCSPRCTLPIIFWVPTPLAIPAHRRSTSLIILHLSAQAWLIIVIWAPGGGGKHQIIKTKSTFVLRFKNAACEQGREQVHPQAFVCVKLFIP